MTIAPTGGFALARRPGHGTPRRRAAIRCEMLEGRRLLSTLTQGVQRLAGDLEVIQQRSNLSGAEVGAVTSDFEAIASVATRPAPTTVTTLATELRAIRSAGQMTRGDAAALKKDASAVLTSASVPASLAHQTISDVASVLTASGVTRSDAKTVLGDIKTIVTELGSPNN